MYSILENEWRKASPIESTVLVGSTGSESQRKETGERGREVGGGGKNSWDGKKRRERERKKIAATVVVLRL